MKYKCSKDNMAGIVEIIDKNIDGGKAFDWGKASSDYAKIS